MAYGLTQFRVGHALLKTHQDYFLANRFFNWVEQRRGFTHSIESHYLIDKKFKDIEDHIKKIMPSKLGNLVPQIFECLVNTYMLCDSSPRSFDALLLMPIQRSSRMRVMHST